jgi:hypothetical protein
MLLESTLPETLMRKRAAELVSRLLLQAGLFAQWGNLRLACVKNLRFWHTAHSPPFSPVFSTSLCVKTRVNINVSILDTFSEFRYIVIIYTNVYDYSTKERSEK